MDRPNRTRSFIVKPVSLNCNQKCAYCYNGIDHLNRIPRSLMSLETADVFIKSLPSLNEKTIKIIWHGGEPLLRGRNFYNEIIYMQKRLVDEFPDLRISNSFMTNGTLIDDNWGEFIKENKWQVCISLDGPQEIHDKYRIDSHGNGTHEKVIRGIEIVKKHGLTPNFLTVVTRETLKHSPVMVHNYLTSICKNFDYLPCWEMPFDGHTPEYVISPEEFLNFIKDTFDCWWEKDDPSISVRLFQSLIQGALGGNPRTCAFMGTCSQFTAINSDGSVYPCGKYSGLPEFFLGNIYENNLGDILDSSAHKNYLAIASDTPQKCSECKLFKVCHNGCTYERYLGNGNFRKDSPFCDTWKSAYEYVEQKIILTKQQLENEDAQQ